MTQPETNSLDPHTPESNQEFLSLKAGKANKTGKCSQGYIHYRVLTDPSFQQLYITIVGNDGGGCYSKEIVPFDKVERCLQSNATGKPITSKLFQQAFVSKSVNNAGFMAAILRAENILLAVPDAPHQHALNPNWEAWKADLQALIPQAVPYHPEPIKPRGGNISKKPATPVTTSTPSPAVQQDVPQPPTDKPNPSMLETTTSDTTDLDESDMALLERCSMGDDKLQQEEVSGDDTDHIANVPDKRQTGKQRRDKHEHSSTRGG